ncbi:hypothetical protein F4778DRAFT_715127 [Xylariomycetidae sp. FL2044]|nr:hypothetical protein F4778DRAFT_715127 [Xylariomycetidae sp. FL2044]
MSWPQIHVLLTNNTFVLPATPRDRPAKIGTTRRAPLLPTYRPGSFLRPDCLDLIPVAVDSNMSDQDTPHPIEWGPGKTPQGRARLPSSRRRDKPQLSCNLCKRRKLRCDRQNPCSTCDKRGLGLSCTYSATTDSTTADASHRRPPATVHERIHQLEGLVVSLMHQTVSPSAVSVDQLSDGLTTPAPRHDSAGGVDGRGSPGLPLIGHVHITSKNVGSLQATRSGPSYVSSAHWEAVLDGIAELKEHFNDEEQETREAFEPSPLPLDGPQLLYGCVVFATREEILASVPPRPVVDQLVSRYFDSFEMSPAVLHSSEFLKEYENFWTNQSEAQIVWLGLLFSILCLATEFEKFNPSSAGASLQTTQSSELELNHAVQTFRHKTVQCLVLGNYAKGGKYVLETLMLYITVEVFTRKDAEIGVWILLGTVVQLAMHMGYHRDPKHFKDMSSFDGEMRKRVWATVVELDLGISTQMGHPRLIKPWQADTPEPSNLQDSDFDKSTPDMPASRPESDLTPMLFRLVRSRMMVTIGLIWDFAADVRPSTSTEVMNMDAKLRETHASIPECLRWRSISHCLIDSTRIIMQKVSLDIIFHKARIVLHRKNLLCSPSEIQSESQQACLDAALKLLGIQHMLHVETQPLRRLHQERWKVSSLVNHDFLLATSVLCSYLQQAEIPGYPSGLETPVVDNIRQSLRKSHDIWIHSSSSSKEARKAADALGVILGARAAPRTSVRVTSTSGGNNIPMPSAYSTGNFIPDNVAGFATHFPGFDMDLIQDWANPPGAFTSTTADSWPALSDSTIQAMAATDTTGSLSWPWTM